MVVNKREQPFKKSKLEEKARAFSVKEESFIKFLLENRRARLNLGMIGMTIFLLAFYAVISNNVVSKTFAINQLKNQFSAANVNSELVSVDVENRLSLDNLINYARQKGLVEAKDPLSIVADNEVATLPTKQ